ncbi:hypothetical protein BC826DRAFT_1025552 [Russula brevipes]|nr:hypothetical protein BC826DRAFT_1025552 [Russula brevipes]
MVDFVSLPWTHIPFLIFGCRTVLSSALMWKSIPYPPIFAHPIDVPLIFLTSWNPHNTTFTQNLAAYSHLYSFASIKSVVHRSQRT